MIKKILLFIVLSLMILQNIAFAFETEGEVIFKDTLYGVAIGSLLGSAFYLVDQDDFAKKFSTGVIIGAIGGLVFGFVETSSFVEIKKDEIKIAFPTPVIEKKNNDIRYSASLLKTKF